MRFAWIKSLAAASVLLAGPVMAGTPAENLAAAEAFMAEVTSEPNVVTLPSGVAYVVVSSPDPQAPQPAPSDTVVIDYIGALSDGTVFDASQPGQPASLPLTMLIPAWQQVIPLMHVGDEFLLITPPSAAYGEQDMGVIPPNSALIFRIRLNSIAAN